LIRERVIRYRDVVDVPACQLPDCPRGILRVFQSAER
jgi:hypothetical protein